MVEAGVLDSNLWLQQLWAHAPDAMAVSDASGTVLAANPAYFELYGYAPEEVLGRHFALIFPSEQRATAQAQYEEVFNSPNPPEVPRSIVRNKTGADRVVQARVVFVDVPGERKAMLSIIRDVTEEVSAHRLAERAQADMQTLLLSLSHDIKNPLSVIKGHAQVLRRMIARRGAPPSAERVAETLMQIETSTLRVDQLVDELVEVATLEDRASVPLHLSEVDLIALVREMVDRYRCLADRHTVAIEANADSLVGLWDGRRLMRVVDNLVSNAIKYSPDGGVITIRLTTADSPLGREPDQSGDSPERPASGVLLSVQDTGIGIAADDLPHVFDRFRRGSNVPGTVVGSGIGLTSVEQIVHQHSGQIHISSKLGAGTTVSLWLPLHPLDSKEQARDA